MRHVVKALLLICSLWFSDVRAQDISNENGAFGRTISFFDPVGQSFTAVSVSIDSIAVSFAVANVSSPNEPISTVLFDGAGLTGNILATGQITLPVDLTTNNIGPLIDLGLGQVSLTVGQVYTFAVFVPSDSPRNKVAYGNFNAYSGGQMFHGPGAFSLPDASDDMRFYIRGDVIYQNGFDN